MSIKDMITQDEFNNWYFHNFHPLLLWEMHTDNNENLKFWYLGLKG